MSFTPTRAKKRTDGAGEKFTPTRAKMRDDVVAPSALTRPGFARDVTPRNPMRQSDVEPLLVEDVGKRADTSMFGPRTDATLAGVASGATLGGVDELAGAGEALLGAGEEDSSLLERYRRGRDSQRAYDKKAQSEHPAQYTGGALAGGAASMALGPASIVGQGAAAGFLGSDADLTRPSVDSALESAGDTALGAGGAYLGDKAFRALGKGVSRVLLGKNNNLRDAAGELAVRATYANKSDVRRAGGGKKVIPEGINMLEEGLVPWFGRAEDIGERAAALKKEAGGKMGTILEGIDKLTGNGFDWQRAATRVRERFGKLGHAQQDEVAPAVEHLISVLERNGKTGGGFAAANDQKSFLQQMTGKYASDIKADQKAKNTMLGLFNDEIEQQMQEGLQKHLARKILPANAGDPITSEVAEMAKQGRAAFETQKKRFGTGATASALTHSGELGQIGNRLFSLTDNMAGMTGAAVSDGDKLRATLTGLALATGNKLARERLPAGAARAAFAASKKFAPGELENGLGRFGALFAREYQARGEHGVKALWDALAAKSPEFQKELQGMLAGGEDTGRPMYGGTIRGAGP